MGNKLREVHQKKSLTFRKGKARLRSLSIKQLLAIVEKEKTGKRFDAAQKEIVRKQKIGLIYKKPAAEADNEEIRNNQ